MFPTPGNSDSNTNRNRALLAAFLGAALVVGVLAFLMNPLLITRAILPIAVSVLVVVLPTVYFLSRGQDEKRKRDGQDMYAMIDRLVDDLDEDEIAYLEQRLEARDAERKTQLSEEVVALINLRELDRRSGRR